MANIESLLCGENFGAVALNDDWSAIIFYQPYAQFLTNGLSIDAFYVASNELYFKVGKIMATLRENGFECDRNLEIGLKPLGQKVGIGKILRNQLLCSPIYGTRIALDGIRVRAKFEKILDGGNFETPCDKCRQCENSCPEGALREGGFLREKCLRQAQSDCENISVQQGEAMGASLLGCDICQRVCPMQKIKPIYMPLKIEDLLQAENVCKMVLGDKALREKFQHAFGKNYMRPRRLAFMLVNALGNIGDDKSVAILDALRGQDKTLDKKIENSLLRLNTQKYD